MTELLKKVKKLKDTLLGLEMELDILEQDLFELTVDLNHLIKLEKSLMYNINFLKNDASIIIASEYKKSIMQLKDTRKKIDKYKIIRNKVINKMKNKIESKKFYQKEFNSSYKQLEDDQIILVFKTNKGS